MMTSTEQRYVEKYVQAHVGHNVGLIHVGGKWQVWVRDDKETRQPCGQPMELANALYWIARIARLGHRRNGLTK